MPLPWIHGIVNPIRSFLFIILFLIRADGTIVKFGAMDVETLIGVAQLTSR